MLIVFMGGQRLPHDRSRNKKRFGVRRLALNPNDDGAMERVVNVPPRGIGRAQHWLRYENLPVIHGCSMWKAAQECG